MSRSRSIVNPEAARFVRVSSGVARRIVAHSRFDFHRLVQGLTRSADRRTKCVSQRFARGAWREALRTFAPGFNREEPWVPRGETGATISIESEGCTFSGSGRDNVASVSVAGPRAADDNEPEG